MSGSKVLIVEDEVIVAMSIERTLSSFGYDVVGLSTTPEDAIRIAEELRPDLVLMDINLDGEIDGIDAAEKISQISDIPVVYLTSYTNEKTLRRALGTNPYGYLTKPVRPKEIYTVIETVLNKRRAEMAEKELKESKRTQWEVLNSLDLGLCIAGYESGEERCSIVAINDKACEILGVPGRELWENKADLEEYIPGISEAVSHSIKEGKKSVLLRSAIGTGERVSGKENGFLLRVIGSNGNYSIIINFIDNTENRDLLNGVNVIGSHISSILALCDGNDGIADEIAGHAKEIEKMLNY